MNTVVTIYNNTTGEVLSIQSFSDTLLDKVEANLEGGESMFPGEYSWEGYYIDVGRVIHTPTTRGTNPATISDQTISNIPNPSTVDCGELGQYEVTDGDFDFTITTPGTYQITVRSVKFLDKTFEVVIT